MLYTIHDLGLEGCVRLVGQLSADAVRQRLQNADAFLLSSVSEGLSNAALEAMACGLPVVATDCGGMREAITNGVEGLIIPVRDAPALAVALERLWRDPVLRLRVGADGPPKSAAIFQPVQPDSSICGAIHHLMSAGRSSMRLVLLVPVFPKLSETFIVSKFIGLLESGWDVHVACAQLDWAAWKDIRLPGQTAGLRRRVHAQWPVRPRGLAALLSPLALLRCLLGAPRHTARYLRRGWQRFGFDVLRRLYLDAELIRLRPDLIHFEFGSLAPDRIYLKELLGCQVVVSFRGYDLNYVGLDQPGYYQAVWDGAEALHLLGEDLWRRAQRRGCPEDKRHVLIPPAIDVDEFKPEGRDDGAAERRPLRILSVGRLEWKKGYEYSLQAVRLLLDRGYPCEYRILGGGNYLEAITFARHQMGLEATVKLLGAQPQRAVKEQMAWADVLLHAAVSEGFCNAVIEAQAMQLPVVCSDADGLRENIVDGVTGFIVPRRDPRALADKLEQLAGDPGLRQRMGRAGRKRVLRCFQLDDQITAFEQLYRELLS